jgi:GT2 family glycosyltransferase
VTATPEISVVIPTYRRPELLRACLGALRNQDLAVERFQVVVVNDASGDETPDVLAKASSDWPQMTAINQPANRGPATARNAGVAASRAPLVLFIDDDIVASPSLLSQHLRFHEAGDPSVGMVGRVEWLPSIEVTSFMRWLDSTDLQFKFASMTEGPVENPWEAFYTCNLSIPTQLLRDAGGFDERFPYPAFEDTDLGVRLARRGFRLEYRPSALAWHSRSVTLEEFCRRSRQVGESATVLQQTQPDLPFDLAVSADESGGLRRLAIRSLPTVAKILPVRRLKHMSYLAQVNHAHRDGVRAGLASAQNLK